MIESNKELRDRSGSPQSTTWPEDLPAPNLFRTSVQKMPQTHDHSEAFKPTDGTLGCFPGFHFECFHKPHRHQQMVRNEFKQQGPSGMTPRPWSKTQHRDSSQPSGFEPIDATFQKSILWPARLCLQSEQAKSHEPDLQPGADENMPQGTKVQILCTQRCCVASSNQKQVLLYAVAHSSTGA